MSRRVLRVALTGGIATGKTYCLGRFAALGVPCIDADRLAREAVATGTPGLAAVVARFGTAILAGDGSLDRPALARVVFADATARRDLERIVHPVVRQAVDAWFDGLDVDTAAGPGFAVADIPLLYETDGAGRFDRVVVAACRPDQQIARVCARDGLDEADARARLAAQVPIDDKRRRADHVIDTSGTLADTDRQVTDVYAALRQAAADARI